MKKLLTILILAAALFGLTYLVKPQLLYAPSHQEVQQQPVVQNDYVKYYGQDGKTALEILKIVTTVQTKNYPGVGVFVQSINGVAPDERHFWKLYVNGSESQVGADQVQTKNGDTIEWKLEEIK